MTPAHIMGTYFHEIKHYECATTNCVCFKTSSMWLKESHALENELVMGLKYEFPEALRTSILGILTYMYDVDQPFTYRFAAFRTHRRIIWRETTEYLEKYNEKLLQE